MRIGIEEEHIYRGVYACSGMHALANQMAAANTPSRRGAPTFRGTSRSASAFRKAGQNLPAFRLPWQLSLQVLTVRL